MRAVAATEVVDDYLDSTDHIAYQYSNLIQSNVLFFNVDRETHTILNVSTNVQQWLGLSATDVVDRILTDDLFLGIADALRIMEQRFARPGQSFITRIGYRDSQNLVCRIAATSTRWLVEVELEHHPSDIVVDHQRLDEFLLSCIQSLSGTGSLQELVTHTTAQLRELLGFQRGMCYQFDQENNGEVIAESTATPGEEKYLGLRFPARDVPRAAREMLLASPIRTTLDQRADCHQIYPSRDPITHEYIDLTLVRGRGAAGACREYYLNLNVRSTCVLPLVVENHLWGLLAFHDSETRRVHPRLDEHLQAIARCLSIALESNLRATRESLRKKGQQVVKALSEVDATSNQWLHSIQTRANDLKELIPCGGFLLRLAGEILVAGAVPEPSDRQFFTDKLYQLSRGQPLSTNRLAVLSHDVGKFSQLAAGAIAVPLSADHSDMAVWIRPEQRHTVKWAGDPLSHQETGTDGIKRLSVRESFEVWTRVNENASLPWTEQELALANSASMQLSLLTLSWYAAQAVQAKTQFLSCMSHEIRTPMTAILGYANLLKEHLCSADSTDASPQACEFVEIIERNSRHLLAVIDDILNLAKIEAGKLTVERIPIAIGELLTDVFALIKVQAEIRQLGFILELETPVPRTIFGDPVRLRQILLNLLGNAFKFTERGQVRLKVGYQASTQQMTFEVIDTGIGMTPAQVQRLFSAFSQADTSTTRRFGGSGLGLQISKNLAQLLGGDISVHSQPGIGSTFRLTIDSGCAGSVELIDRITEKTSGPPSPNHSTSTSPSLNGQRIMLLEDGEDNQRLLGHILRKAGAEVTIFANGKLGIEAISVDGQLDGPLQHPFPFDLILTDMQMPELDGYSSARLLRQKGCDLPIIALTAFAMEGNAAECLSAGCDDYLSKPIKRDALLAMCAKWSRVPVS